MSDKLRVLIVEDNPADADLIQEMLPRVGLVSFQIESVARLSEALTRLERKGIDLVLLDLGLPDSQGLQTFHKLRDAAPGVPVVVLTGTDDHETAVQLVREGAQDYLVKGQVRGHLLVLAARYALERKRAAEALRASELRYRRLFESAKDGILILDAETGMVVDVNPFLIELLAFSREDFLRKRVWELGFFKDIVANRACFEELQQKEYVRYEDRPLETADGRRIEVEFVSNVYLVNGRKVIQCNVRDFTERKQAQAALRASELEFHSLAESMPQIVWVTRPDGWNVYFNRQWVEYTGLTLEESYGHGWNIPFHPDDRQRAWDAWQNATQRDATYSLECRLRRADGAYRWWLVRGVPLRDASGTILKWFGTCTDIEDLKRTEQALRQSEARLRQQQKLESIGTLAGGVAHEINNPINGIMNYAQLIQDRLEPGSPLTDYTGGILRETERVAAIVHSLLTFARSEKQSHSPARMADIIEGTLSLVRAVIRHDQIALTVNVPADLPDLRCRSQQIQQVLMNLITNARDTLNDRYPGYHEDKKILVSATCISNAKCGMRIAESENGAGPPLGTPQSAIRITVEDHGTGIAPEVRERMFDPFFTTKPRDKGTGLGLSVSHGIVKEHHGALTVESEPGRFTRMHVDLPL